MIYMVRTDLTNAFTPLVQINAKTPIEALYKVLESQNKAYLDTIELKKAPKRSVAQFEVTEQGMNRFYDYYFVAVQKKFVDLVVDCDSAITSVWYNGHSIPIQGKQLFKCEPSQTLLFIPSQPNTGIGIQEKDKIVWLCTKQYKRAKVRLHLTNFRKEVKENLLVIEQRADGKIIFNLDKSLGLVKTGTLALLR